MWQIIVIPFLGTTLGAACVFFFRKNIGTKMQRAFTGFASGVMVAASFFSLILPALDQTSDMGKLGFIPVSVGFGIGMLFLLVLDLVTPHMHTNKSEEGPKSGLKRTTKLILAVTLHNIPEGMAVGKFARDGCRGMKKSPIWAHLHWQSVSPFRISRRVQLFRCRFWEKECRKGRHFCTECFPESWNRSVHFW